MEEGISLDERIKEIFDRLRSLRKMEKKIQEERLRHKEIALKIGKDIHEIKRFLKKKRGKNKIEINKILRKKFKKDRRRINDYEAAYRVVRNHEEHKEADLCVLITLGQALNSRIESRREIGKKIAKKGKLPTKNGKKKALRRASRLELQRALRSIAGMPEYLIVHRLSKISTALFFLSRELEDEVLEMVLIKSLKEVLGKCACGWRIKLIMLQERLMAYDSIKRLRS